MFLFLLSFLFDFLAVTLTCKENELMEKLLTLDVLVKCCVTYDLNSRNIIFTIYTLVEPVYMALFERVWIHCLFVDVQTMNLISKESIFYYFKIDIITNLINAVKC